MNRGDEANSSSGMIRTANAFWKPWASVAPAPAISHGSEKIRILERALGGTPPKEALEKSRAALQRHSSERFKAQKRARQESARLAEPLRSLMLSHVAKDDPKLKRSMEDTRAAYELRSKHKLKMPKLEKFEASLSVGSISLIKVPPYDAQWSFNPAASTQARANSSTGTYHLAVQSIGDGALEVAAGVGVWFFAPATDAQQRFAALMDYCAEANSGVELGAV